MTLEASYLPAKEVKFLERHPMNEQSRYKEFGADKVSVDEKALMNPTLSRHTWLFKGMEDDTPV